MIKIFLVSTLLILVYLAGALSENKLSSKIKISSAITTELIDTEIDYFNDMNDREKTDHKTYVSVEDFNLSKLKFPDHDTMNGANPSLNSLYRAHAPPKFS